MTEGHAKIVIGQLAQLGWQISAPKEILKVIPKDNDYLIQKLTSPAGQRLLRELPNEKMLYDRLDRIILQPGGRRLVADLLKLPDGHRYAKANRPRAVPGMEDFLPKTSGGRDRKITDYDQPTGRLYTLPQFLDCLKKVHREDLEKFDSSIEFAKSR
jgi:hypothetical protein